MKTVNTSQEREGAKSRVTWGTTQLCTGTAELSLRDAHSDRLRTQWTKNVQLCQQSIIDFKTIRSEEFEGSLHRERIRILITLIGSSHMQTCISNYHSVLSIHDRCQSQNFKECPIYTICIWYGYHMCIWYLYHISYVYIWAVSTPYISLSSQAPISDGDKWQISRVSTGGSFVGVLEGTRLRGAQMAASLSVKKTCKNEFILKHLETVLRVGWRRGERGRALWGAQPGALLCQTLLWFVSLGTYIEILSP